ncbi:N-acetylglucosaminylphosphatidylinositoldeacety la se [Mycena amicta]|nr:N-acetylglucosaminylphosphatidylinositoldeacety la se [Mycena amicta]
MVKTFNVVVVVLALVVAFLRLPTQSDNSVSHQFDPLKSPSLLGNVLILTAHPDDECMFFAPTILALTALQHARNAQSSLFSLCLSAGNADGLGLERSLEVLGVDVGKRLLVNHPDLQDNISAQWDAYTIAGVLKPFILANHINTILTFDKEGVSGHPNHKSLPEGVKQLMASLPQVRLFTLLSTPLPIKYMSIVAPTITKFDLNVNSMFNDFEAWVTRLLLGIGIDLSGFPQRRLPPPTAEYWTAVQAMRRHPSQLVWYRWLYVAFSRYMWVNEWEEVQI